MAKFEPQVMAGKVESIHDYRVAVRRIRSALRLIAESGEDKKADKLRKRGGDFAHFAGRVRDLDVLLKEAKADKKPPAPEAWIFSLTLERESSWTALKQLLSSKKYERWEKKLATWLDEDLNDVPLRKGWEKAVKEYTDAVCQWEKAASDEELHALRIAVKRLRYLLEFFEDYLMPDARKRIARLSDIQGRLGEHHDLSVALAKLDGAIAASGGLEIVEDLRRYRSGLARRKANMRPKKDVAEAIELARVLVRSSDLA